MTANSTEIAIPPGQCISSLINKDEHPYKAANWSAVSELMTNDKTMCAVDLIQYIWEDGPCYYEEAENDDICSWAFVIGMSLLTLVLFVAVCATMVLLARFENHTLQFDTISFKINTFQCLQHPKVEVDLRKEEG